MTSPPARSTAGTLLPARVVAGLGGLSAVAAAGLLSDGLSRPGPVSWLTGTAAAAAGSSAVLLAVAAVLLTATLRGTRRVYGWLLGASLAAFGVATLGRLTVAIWSGGAASSGAVQLQRGFAALATLGTLLGCVVLVRLRASRPARGEVFGEATLAVAVAVLAALQAGSYLAGLPAGTDWVRRGQVVAAGGWLLLAGFLLARLTGGPAWRAGVEPSSSPERVAAAAPVTPVPVVVSPAPPPAAVPSASLRP